MPIRPENRDRYPPDWQTRIRPLIMARARRVVPCDERRDGTGNPRCQGGRVPVNQGEALGPFPVCRPDEPPVERCECRGECNGEHTPFRCEAVNGRPHPVTGSRVVLTIAHLDHVPEHCDPENLRAMCQSCHLAYDAEHHRIQRDRNRIADLEAAGQGTLDLEVTS